MATTTLKTESGESTCPNTSDPRLCSRCEEVKPASHFNRHRRTCKACRAELQRQYVARNREKVYLQSKAWRDAGGRRRATVAVYGITIEQYGEMLEAQGGVCAICREPCPSGKNLAVDHCHETGAVRGLLCARCNSGIGQFLDSPDRLRAAIGYLER